MWGSCPYPCVSALGLFEGVASKHVSIGKIPVRKQSDKQATSVGYEIMIVELREPVDIVLSEPVGVVLSEPVGIVLSEPVGVVLSEPVIVELSEPVDNCVE